MLGLVCNNCNCVRYEDAEDVSFKILRALVNENQWNGVNETKMHCDQNHIVDSWFYTHKYPMNYSIPLEIYCLPQMLTQVKIQFLKIFPCFYGYGRALLHIFWKSRECPDRNTLEEDAETCDIICNHIHILAGENRRK